jgi:hypothetical protein
VAINSTNYLGVPPQQSPPSGGSMMIQSTVVKPPPVQFTALQLDTKHNVVLSGNGGPANGTYCIWSTTNLVLPSSQWSCVATNNFNPDGSFNITLPITSDTAQQYYRLQAQ